MIILDCEQGSDEWIQGRLGVATSSEFGRILTPTGKASTQAKAYMNKLLAEWMTQKPLNGFSNEYTEEGKEREEEACAYFAFQRDVELEKVGLVYKDKRRLVACSPDRLMPAKGLEVKNPAPNTQVDYLLRDRLPNDYIPQVQGSMYVTGFKTWWFMSYCPGLPALMIEVERDEEYIGLLDISLTKFINEMLEKREQLKTRMAA